MTSRILLFSALCLCLRSGARAQAVGDQEGPLQAATDTSRQHMLTNDTIVRMTRAGLDDSLILQTIQLQAGQYDTMPDALIALKTAGVSQQVLAAMQAHASGLSTRAAGTAVDPAGVALGSVAAGIDEIGVYYKDKDGQWTPLKTERVEFRSGGWLKSAATHDIIKEDMNGSLDGEKSPLVLPTSVTILIYAPAGTQAEEYDFIRFREKSGRREFRVKTGGVFHSETGSQRDEIEFHPHKVAAQMYSFTVPKDLEKGEYGVLPPGSSNTPGMVHAGKMFTFSIRE